MNLNKFKKTIGKNDPEKGLRSLVGAQKKREPHGTQPGAIRVNGIYRPVDQRKSGDFFGVMAYLAASLSSLGMVVSVLIPALGHPSAYFFLGILPVHGFAMLSDNIGSSKTPWAGKSVRLFWAAAALALLLGVALGGVG